MTARREGRSLLCGAMDGSKGREVFVCGTMDGPEEKMSGRNKKIEPIEKRAMSF